MGCRELSTEVGVLSCVFWYSMLHVWDWVGGWGRNQDCNLVFFAATFPHRRSLGPGSAESTGPSGVPVAQVACGMQIAKALISAYLGPLAALRQFYSKVIP